MWLCMQKAEDLHQVSQHCIQRFELSMNCLGVTYLGIRCPKIVLVSSHVQALGVQKVLRRHMSGRQVSKTCLGVTCPDVRCPKRNWASHVRASGVQNEVGRQVSGRRKSGRQVSIKLLGVRCPKVGWASGVY